MRGAATARCGKHKRHAEWSGHQKQPFPKRHAEASAAVCPMRHARRVDCGGRVGRLCGPVAPWYRATDFRARWPARALVRSVRIVAGSACESVRFRIANVNLSHSVWLWACGAGPTRRFQKNILRNELSKLERRAPGRAVGVRLTSPREIAHDHPDGSRESAGAGDENPRRMPTGRTRHAAAQPRGRAEPGFAPLPITGLTRDAGPPRASQPDRGRSADVRRLHSA